MYEFKQIQHGLSAIVFLPHKSNSGSFATGVYLDSEWLKDAIRHMPVNEPDSEREKPVYTSAFLLQQKPCTLFRAWHQRLVMLVQNEYSHLNLLLILADRLNNSYESGYNGLSAFSPRQCCYGSTSVDPFRAYPKRFCGLGYRAWN
jgi:hypothetical protein